MTATLSLGIREFVFSLDTQVEYSEKEINNNLIKTLKAVIIGGHEKWQTRMKELLPGCTFIHTDMVNFDMTVLDTDPIMHILHLSIPSHKFSYEKVTFVS